MTGQHIAEETGDGGGDSATLEPGCCGDKTDPTEATTWVGHTAAGTDDRSVVFDDGEPVGLRGDEAVETRTKRRHPVGPLHDSVHRDERGGLS